MTNAATGAGAAGTAIVGAGWASAGLAGAGMGSVGFAGADAGTTEAGAATPAAGAAVAGAIGDVCAVAIDATHHVVTKIIFAAAETDFIEPPPNRINHPISRRP